MTVKRLLGLTLALGTVAVAAAPATGLPVTRAVLTPDGTPYVLRHPVRGTYVVRSTPHSGDWNEREVFWPPSATSEANSTSCAEWQRGQGIDQQGAALRITDTNGVVRAITVGRSIYEYNFWLFFFLSWNTAMPGYFSWFGGVDLSGYLGKGPAVYPLNLCARTSGNVVQFIIWRPGEAPPPWGSTTQGGSATIPATAPASGFTGWYVGHIVRGTSTTFSRTSVDGSIPRDRNLAGR